MDLGIRGRSAVVTAASKGLGLAAARSLAREGVALTINARSSDALEAAAAALRTEFGVPVTAVAADVNTADGRRAILSAAGDGPDILVMQAVAPGMAARRFGRIVAMSVSFIKFPQVGFAHSHAARVALSGAIAAMTRELVPHNVTINTVCPGLFDTEALHTNLHGHARRGNTTYEAIVADRLKGCPAGRFADPSECGDLIAYLCSAQAGFMTGQNIVNDGGVYQGLF
jgi:3-oxoacyl-[acyl-carrier protein] reductase